LPLWEVPITSITNGVHLPSWLNGDLASLYDQYLQPDWRDRFNDPTIWEQVKEIPDEELLEAHRRRKRRLVSFVRSARALRRCGGRPPPRRCSGRLGCSIPTLSPSGSRAASPPTSAPRCCSATWSGSSAFCLNKDLPVQIVIAGKAHPKDQPGKSYIREIVQLSRDPDLWKHVVFLEDYDMKVAREMVQGVDLWLNNPRRGEEACGTSGMKAAINGVLNFSILDGWFDEAYEHSGGWAIGDREPYSEDQDALHASAIYYLLESEIAPMFYERREQTPREWMRRMKQSIMYTSPHFDCRRMVREYMTELYEPAHLSHLRILKTDYAWYAKERVGTRAFARSGIA
jgi:starch phosphorylase